MNEINNCKLRNSRQFNLIYKTGKSIVTKYIVMYYKENNENFNRIGYSVSKKVGKSVVRNRVKRLMKESYRLNNYYIRKNYDIVFIARVRMNRASYKETEKNMNYLLRKLGK